MSLTATYHARGINIARAPFAGRRETRRVAERGEGARGQSGRARGCGGRDLRPLRRIIPDMRSRYWITVTLAAFAVYSVIATLGSVSTLAYWSHVRFDTDVEGF